MAFAAFAAILQVGIGILYLKRLPLPLQVLQALDFDGFKQILVVLLFICIMLPTGVPFDVFVAASCKDLADGAAFLERCHQVFHFVDLVLQLLHLLIALRGLCRRILLESWTQQLIVPAFSCQLPGFLFIPRVLRDL
jgi:hypothetical protein